MTADSPGPQQFCRHCGVPVELKNPTAQWWHRGTHLMYRACRDKNDRLIGDHLAEPGQAK